MIPTCFASVEAAMEELQKSIPDLHLVELLAKRRGDVEIELMAHKLLGFLEGDGLRKALEAAKKPDGTVQFGFTREAWKALREAGLE